MAEAVPKGLTEHFSAGAEFLEEDPAVRALEEQRHCLEPLLRQLVQRRARSEDEALAAAGLALARLAETVGATDALVFSRNAEGELRLMSHCRADPQTGAFLAEDAVLPCDGEPTVFHQSELGRLGRVAFTGAVRRWSAGSARIRSSDRLRAPQDLPGDGERIVPGDPSLTRFGKDESAEAEAHLANGNQTVEAALGIETEALVSAPIRVFAEAAGSVELVRRRGDSERLDGFSALTLRLLESLGRTAGRMIELARNRYDELRPEERSHCLARLARAPFVGIDTETVDPSPAATCDFDRLRSHRLLPLEQAEDGTMTVVITDPLDVESVRDFEIETGAEVGRRYVTTPSEMERALSAIEASTLNLSRADVLRKSVIEQFVDKDARRSGPLPETIDEYSTPIVKLANFIIEEAVRDGASDIHLEPRESQLVLRYRVDGRCSEKDVLPKRAHRALINRLKIMAMLDISERRLPQDGRIAFQRFNAAVDVDLRVSTAPMMHGESIVMRLIDKERSTLTLNQLGFNEEDLARYRQIIEAPYGMILHAGPTGSGKSMSLCSALASINDPADKILTAEDPIEYTLEGINQLEVRPDIGLTFARALRCFLRQDPDIILVGEIRDRETAQIAVEASLTGHKLFSTLHTNDAASSVTRLIEIGVDPYLVATALLAVCAQRLARRLCRCKVSEPLTAGEQTRLANDGLSPVPTQLYRASGCKDCKHLGYSGRVGVFELLEVNDAIRRGILESPYSGAIKVLARDSGMITLFEDAIDKMLKGVVSLSEVYRIVPPDEGIAEVW